MALLLTIFSKWGHSVRTKLMSVSTLALLASVSFPVASMADIDAIIADVRCPDVGGPDSCKGVGGKETAYSWLVMAIGNDQKAYYHIHPTGILSSDEDKAAAIYIRVRPDANQLGQFGVIAAINEGVIETGADSSSLSSMQHGMALGYTIASDSALLTGGDVFAVNSGKIITRNASSHGIAIERSPLASGKVVVDNRSGNIQILHEGEVHKQLRSSGINVIDGGFADLDINVGNIVVRGAGAGAELVTRGSVDVILEDSGKVTIHGKKSQGILASSWFSETMIDVAGTIIMYGDDSTGIEAVGSSSAINVDGYVEALALNSNGLNISSTNEQATVTIGSTGEVIGGRGQGSAMVVGSFNDIVEVTNDGALSALSDRLITDLSDPFMGPVGDFKVTNNGLMTGFVKLGSNGGNYFENTSKFISRNFSASNPDGERDLRGVAVNDMGGDNSHFVNAASGVVSLGASSAENFDATGYYKARTGINNRLFSQDIYDFERKGLLQTQFTNTASFKNEGLIDLTGEQVGNTLVITSSSDAETIGSGTYVSGGTLKLGAELNDGDGGQGSKADMLIADRVEKGANATTIEVAVKSEANAALTKQNGIQLVQVRDKDHSAEGAFMLGGSNAYEHNNAMAIGQGAYAYKLYQNGLGDDKADGNWYLRSQVKDDEPGEELFTGGVPLYEAYPQFLLGLNSLPTLQQRVGNRYWNNAGNKLLAQGADVVEAFAPAEEAGVHIEENAIWGRIEGAHTKIRSRETTSGTDYDYNTFKMQAGLDGLLHESEDGKLIGGITAHYTNGKAEVYSKHGKGDIKTDGYGLGATLTWYGENGFYVDNQAQLTWYDSDLNSSTAKKSMVKGNDGFGYTLSVETGKRSELNEHWSLTPQAQLQYSNVDFDSFVDPFKGHVSRKRGESLEGRLGLSLEHQDSWFNDEGRINRSYVYGIANLYSEFLNGTKVRVDDENFINKRERVWAGIGLGGSYNWNDDKYSVYGEGSVYTSLKHFGDSYSYKGTVGLRIKW
ncbi:autotransporter outer membrane beta-barrel domain-containing protein [Paenochrobactrum glaciei]